MKKTQLLFAMFLLISTISFGQTKITEKEYKTHLRFLASDSLKGRYPATAESEVAAEYIRNEFKKAGLTLTEDGGFQTFDIVTGIEPGDNYFKAATLSAEPAVDFIPLPVSANSELTAGVSFVGYGLPADSASGRKSSYEGIDVYRKWVMVLQGSPEGKRRIMPGSPASLSSKIRLAKKLDAAGLILVFDSQASPEDELTPLSYRRGSHQGDIPVIQIKRELANQILQIAGEYPIDEQVKKIKENNQPVSFNTKVSISAKTELLYITKKARNVVGMLKGSDPELSDEYIIIGAHYDHLGKGEHGSRDSQHNAIHYGADDNASGTAAVIETAEYFGTRKSRSKRSMIFIAFDAEEMGLLGSAYYADNAKIDISKTYAMINFDMIGRLSDEKPELVVNGTGTAEEFEDILESYKKKTDIAQAFNPGGQGASDHSSFYRKDIPVLFFSTGGHDDYHTSRDTYDKINYGGMEELTEYTAELIEYLANRKESLTFKETGNKHQPQRMTLKVTLGVMPGFGATDVKGLRIDGISEGGPAEAAGLQKGDVIKKMGEYSIKDIYEYMEVLQKFEPGQEVELEYERDETLKIVTVKL
jgi:hypothetical protein